MFFLAKFASAQEGPMVRRGPGGGPGVGAPPHTVPTPCQHVRTAAPLDAKKLLPAPKNLLTTCWHCANMTLTTHTRRPVFMKKRPFTKAELEEAAAELDSEAAEWGAYCNTCK